MALQVLRHLHNWSLRKEKLLKEDTLLQHKSIKIIKLKQEDTVCIAQSTPPIVVEMESIIPAKKRKSGNLIIKLCITYICFKLFLNNNNAPYTVACKRLEMILFFSFFI